ncbi:MAG: IS110 family transposase [Acidobacteriota bacterium]|nr:IS110 family transposase [Acidobacteriota bacterium]
MQIQYSRCCGIDVHLKSLTVCVLVYRDSTEPEVRKREFATHYKALLNLKMWLLAQKVTHVAMESTGVYWKPVWKALEGKFELILANPFQVKNIPGRKTDAKDSQWLAELLAHGLIRPSFVPSVETRELRDLTRYRVKLTEERTRVHNRIHKVLEDACIKLDAVASDILGKSGRAIIKAIIDGQDDPDWLADKAKGTLRGKRPELRLVLRGRVTEHHRIMLRELMEDLEYTEHKIERIEKTVAPLPNIELVARLCTIPGVDMITAWTILAELGSDMSQFKTPKHAASWSGLCPGNHESAGKRLSNRTRKGNRWLRRALCQAAWAATRKNNCYLAAFFYRKSGKHGIRKAIVALAHRILVIAFCILRDGTEYKEVGGDYFDKINPERTRSRLVRRLQRLGHKVILMSAEHPDSTSEPTPVPLKRGRPCKCCERAISCKHKA